jgi:putative flippase GtrA
MAVTEPLPPTSTPAGPLLRIIGDQRVAFVMVGAFNTLNGLAIFAVAQAVLGDSFPAYMCSLGIAHVLAVLVAFVLHRRLVFKVTGHVWLDLARFEAVNLSALGLNVLLLPYFVEVVGLGVIWAQCAAGGLSVVLTYFAHRFFSFRRPEPASTETASSETVPS